MSRSCFSVGLLQLSGCKNTYISVSVSYREAECIFEQYTEKLKVPKVQSGTEVKKKTKKPEKEEFAIPKINCVLSTYYKGTALDGITKKLEEYLDSADIKENEINYI